VLPYWLLFLFPAFAALQERTVPGRPMVRKPLFIGAALLFTMMIGFRYRVGGDWGSYINYLNSTRYITFVEVFNRSDPGYIFLNWLVTQTVGEIWAVNLLCGLIFSIGLVAFARIQPRPWLGLLVAVPYLIIVVAMGYSRQGVAIGLAMLGLVALMRDRSNVKFVIWIALAASFHRTAMVLVPIAALAADRGRIWTASWVGAATLLLYYLYLEDSVDRLVAGYIEAEYQSQGAAIRVTMNALPAALFLVARRRFRLSPSERRLWTIMALLALGFVVLLFVSPSSTAVDRMGLYLIPIQLFVLSRLPDAFPIMSRGVNPATLAVILYSAAVQFVWLNFAAHARYWIPYQLYFLS
jgi:hypothetical protein